MLNYPDALIVLADIDEVAADFPDLDRAIVERVHRRLFVHYGRVPSIGDLRAYLDRVSRLDEATLRAHLGLPQRRRGRDRRPAVPKGPLPIEPTQRPDRHPAAGTAASHRHRRPGRPGWTPEFFWARYREACARCAPPHTYRVIAPHFVALDGTEGTSPEYLRKLVRRFGLPPR